MSRVYYNKLVRDLIEDKIKSKGEEYSLRVIDCEEFESELKKKVVEEATELATTKKREEFLKEYADLMIVLDALTEKMEISPAEIQVALTENIKQKGKFTKAHYLEWSTDETYKSNSAEKEIS